MKRGLLLLLLAVVVGLSIGTSAQASRQSVRYYAGIFPVELPKGGGLATLELRMYEDTTYCTWCRNCCTEEDWREIQVCFVAEKSEKVSFIGDTLWTVYLDDDHRCSTQFQVELLPDDTCYLRMTIRNQTGRGAFSNAYFVTTPDTTEIWYSYPGPRLADRLNRKPDTTLYRAWIDLSDPRRRQVFFEEFEAVEQKYGTPVPVGDSGIYHFRATRDDIRHLIRERWNAGYIDTPPPLPEYKGGNILVVDTLEGRPPVKNPRRPDTTSRGNGEVWIDHIDGADDWCQLRTNELISFRLWFCNNTGHRIGGLGMGFEVSEDPWGPYVDWSYTYLDTSGPLGWYNAFYTLEFFERSVTGYGADSVKLVGVWDLWWGDHGIPQGFTGEALTITIGPIDPAYSGAAICVDSSWVGGASGGGVHQDWIWADSTGYQSFVPEWQGEECFYVVGPGDFPVVGFLQYWDPTPGNERFRPARNVRVELWDYDRYTSDDLLAVTETEADGFFDFGMINNDDGWFGGGLDLYLKAYPSNPACSVVSSHGADCVHASSDTVMDVMTKPHVFFFYLPEPDNGPLFVADVILDGCQKWSDLAGYWPWPPVEVVLNTTDPNGGGTRYIGASPPPVVYRWLR